MREFTNNKSFWLFFIVVLSISFFVFSAATNFYAFSGEQQFFYLAKSFLAGKLYFTERPDTWTDLVLFQGKMYWHMGPFPAILMMPFVYVFSLIPAFYYQGYLQYFLNIGVFYFAYKLALKQSYSIVDAYFLAFAVIFASVYQIAAFVSWPWYLAHAVTAFFGFWAVYEYFGKKRLLLIGTFFAFAFATRLTAGLGVLFFVIDIVTQKLALFNKFKKLVILLFPIFITGLILLLYNYLRFGDFFNNGFKDSSKGILTDTQRYEQINYGIFQPRNIPTNVYYYFFNFLEPVKLDVQTLWGKTHILQPPYLRLAYPGTSVFVVAPIFLYIFRSDIKEKIVKQSLVPIIAILGILMLYYWPGWRQTGPRYLVDLLPFAYLILLRSFKGHKLSVFPKILIIISALVNLYLLQAAFNQV